MNRYTKQLTSPEVQYPCTLLEIKTWIRSYKGVFKESIQTHWELGVEILIDQFSSWNHGKNTWCYKHFKNYLAWHMTSAYLGKICVHFSELFFLKYSENAVLLFENTHNKKGSLFIWIVIYFTMFGSCTIFVNEA